MPRSRLYLPKLASPPATILEHLFERFPHIAPVVWKDRLHRGLVTTSEGSAVKETSPYQHGITLFYLKEVPFEPLPDEAEVVLYSDDEILVVDKPHGMPVTPAGQFVARSLLNRLKEQTGIAELAPLHRLDRDTAGIVLFSRRTTSRGLYHALFAEGRIEREYLAVARCTDLPATTTWRVKNRIVPDEPWFRQRAQTDGEPNATTVIELLETSGDLAIFRLRPQTGKKHQLRVHMTSIGFPIVGDRFYPTLSPPGEGAPVLQLLASRLSFEDPLSGNHREFRSRRRLSLLVDMQRY